MAHHPRAPHRHPGLCALTRAMHVLVYALLLRWGGARWMAARG